MPYLRIELFEKTYPDLESDDLVSTLENYWNDDLNWNVITWRMILNVADTILRGDDKYTAANGDGEVTGRMLARWRASEVNLLIRIARKMKQENIVLDCSVEKQNPASDKYYDEDTRQSMRNLLKRKRPYSWGTFYDAKPKPLGANEPGYQK
jgi:hypothetical protein